MLLFLCVIGAGSLVWVILRYRHPELDEQNVFHERMRRLLAENAMREDAEELLGREFRIALADYGIDPNSYELTFEQDEVLGPTPLVRRTTDGQTWTLSSFDAHVRQAHRDSTP